MSSPPGLGGHARMPSQRRLLPMCSLRSRETMSLTGDGQEKASIF